MRLVFRVLISRILVSSACDDRSNKNICLVMQSVTIFIEIRFEMHVDLSVKFVFTRSGWLMAERLLFQV